jgi:cellobiose phosphorylase
MYRVGLETILGFKLQGDTLLIEPCVPADWPEYTIDFRFRETTYTITVHDPGKLSPSNQEVLLHGHRINGQVIPLVDDGEHHVVLVRPA